MKNFENLAMKELKMLAKVRSINGYENMSRKQLESIFTTSSTPKPTPELITKPKKNYSCNSYKTPKDVPTLFLKPKKPVPISISIDDEFGKEWNGKKQTIIKNTVYEWYDWPVRHIP